MGPLTHAGQRVPREAFKMAAPTMPHRCTLPVTKINTSFAEIFLTNLVEGDLYCAKTQQCKWWTLHGMLRPWLCTQTAFCQKVYRQIANITRTNSQNLNVSRHVLYPLNFIEIYTFYYIFLNMYDLLLFSIRICHYPCFVLFFVFRDSFPFFNRCLKLL